LLTRFGRGDAKSECYSKRVGFFKEGNENVEVEDGVRKSLPQSDGGIQKPQIGVCLHEGQTLNLSKEE
jgi:hypothetical protein